MGRRSTGPKPKKRKKVTVQLIKEKHAGETTEPYRLLSEIRSKEHAHLADAKIGMAWRLGWRSDTDGHLRLGQLKKRSDLDRELDGFDFIILLNKEAWPTLNDKQKRALVDHELCHAQLAYDSDGEPKKDDRGRLVCRIRKHDVEEFRCIVDRHGIWTQDLAAIAKAGINDAKRPLLGVAEGAGGSGNGQASGNGEVGQAGGSSRVGAWRAQPVAALGISEAIMAKLAKVGIETLGQLSDWMEKHGEFWSADIPGIGEAKATDIADRFAAYWEKHPEYTQADPAAAK